MTLPPSPLNTWFLRAGPIMPEILAQTFISESRPPGQQPVLTTYTRVKWMSTANPFFQDCAMPGTSALNKGWLREDEVYLIGMMEISANKQIGNWQGSHWAARLCSK